MQKEGIDPRMVTTPVGAAIGWALTKKIYKNKATLDKKVIGAGLGGGAGFVAGEFMKAQPPGRNPTGVKTEDRAKLDAYLSENPGKAEIDEGTTYLTDMAWGSVMPKDPTSKYVKPYVDASAQARVHGIWADRYQDLARRDPTRRQEYLDAAGKHKVQYDQGMEQIRQNAKSIRNRVWRDKFLGWTQGKGA